MNAFVRSNLSVAVMRLAEAQGRLQSLTEAFTAGRAGLVNVTQALWCVTEAIRLVENAGALDDMESADSVPAPADSNTRMVGQ